MEPTADVCEIAGEEPSFEIVEAILVDGPTTDEPASNAHEPVEPIAAVDQSIETAESARGVPSHEVEGSVDIVEAAVEKDGGFDCALTASRETAEVEEAISLTTEELGEDVPVDQDSASAAMEAEAMVPDSKPVALSPVLAEEEFVLVTARDATASPVGDSQAVPLAPLEHISDDASSEAAGGEMDASVVLETANDELAPVDTPADEDERSVLDVSIAELAGPAAVPIVAGDVVFKDSEDSASKSAVVSDLHNIDNVQTLDEAGSAVQSPHTQATPGLQIELGSGDVTPPEASVMTPSYVMHYSDSVFGDANSIAPGLITMDDLHTAQKASAVVGVSAVNATSVGRKSRESGHHHLHGDGEASVGQRMKRFISGKRTDSPSRVLPDAEPTSPTKGGVTGLLSQYRSSRTSHETKRASATTSAHDSASQSMVDVPEARGARSATVHGSFEDELSKHGHTIPGSFPVERTDSQHSDGEGAQVTEPAQVVESNASSENEGGKSHHHRRHTILGVFKRMFR
ncbi:hypothetical protein GGI04_003900 [Coemansia thaxteri]|nr:hypothetical protein GGI04_003900 [Coemansia thaxteri]